MPTLDVALACHGPGGTKLDPNGVTILDLRGKGVNAVADDTGGALKSLAKLDLSDNVLGNDAVKNLATISSLKHLSLANNGLKGDALRPWLKAKGAGSHDDEAAAAKKNDKKKPAVQARRGKQSRVNKQGGLGDNNTAQNSPLPYLRVLNVSGNNLTSLSGLNKGAPNLGALIATENAIEDLSHLKPLTNLNTVVASSNKIEQIDDEFEDLVNLNKLSLSHNSLTTIGDSLKHCTQLKELRVAHNKLKSLPKVALAGNVNLRVLDVSGNLFSDFGDVESLKALTKLTQLSMRGCPLASTKTYAKTVFKMCPSVKTLDGRKVGPEGWLEKERANGDAYGVRSDNTVKSSTRDNQRDPWADARAAAGLDPLEEAEEEEDEEEDGFEEGDDSDDDEDNDSDSDSDDSDSADDDDDDDDDDDESSEPMDEEEWQMAAEVKALRAKMRAENNEVVSNETATRTKPKLKKMKLSKRGDDDWEDKETRLSKKKPNHSEPTQEGVSFIQEMVARNVGSVRGFDEGLNTQKSMGKPSEGKTADEKNASATRSGVVKVIEVKRPKGTNQNVPRGACVFTALASATGEAEAWGGWGMEGEEEARKETEVQTPSSKSGKKKRWKTDNDGDDVVVLSSKKKKKKRMSDSGGFNILPTDSAVNKKSDDPWNLDSEEARKRKKLLLKRKEQKNLLARRYKK